MESIRPQRWHLHIAPVAQALTGEIYGYPLTVVLDALVITDPSPLASIRRGEGTITIRGNGSSNRNRTFSAPDAKREWRGICNHESVKHNGESIFIDLPGQGLGHQVQCVSAIVEAG